jgi:hypothetical protein
MKCLSEIDDKTRCRARLANDMIKAQKMHKTRFLRQFHIHTSTWNDFVSGKNKMSSKSFDPLFDWFGI